jgi:hypothetical protein
MKRSLMGSVLAVILAAGAYVGSVFATPANKYSPARTLSATFDEIDLNADTLPTNFWRARLKTKGLSQLYVVDNVWKAGGTTGWHTHPGPSLIIVTGGAVTVYESDDPTCTPHVYTSGMGFIDRGDGHAHVVRNEDPVADATTTAVQIIPTLATRRIDAPHPATCPVGLD